MAVPTARPRTRTFNVRSLVTAIAGVEPKYPSYRFSRRSFFERQSAPVTGGTAAVITIPNPGFTPFGTVGVPYTGLQFTATGDEPPYTWSIVAGALPPGMTIGTTTGLVGGTPTDDSGSPYSFTVQAVGSVFGIGTLVHSITVLP